MHQRMYVVIVFSLLIAAMMNMAVAWWIAFDPPAFPSHATTYRSAESGPLWLYKKRTWNDSVRLEGIAATRWAAGGSDAITLKRPPSWSTLAKPPELGIEECIEEAFGFPLPSMGFEIVERGSGWMKTSEGTPGIVLKKPHPHESTRVIALPLQPLWWNFSLNTLFYFVFVLPCLLIMVHATDYVFSTRRRRREMQGRCVRCGYDLRENYEEGCPECGWNREQ